MTLDEAKKEAVRIFPGQEIKFEKRNGVCLLVRERTEQEKTEPTRQPKGSNVLKDGRLALGAGPSWRAALRVAAKPQIVALQAQEQQDRAEVQVERNAFEDFLREKLMPEFEKWKEARSAPVPTADQPAAPAP